MKLYDDTCPGPINKNKGGITKILRKRQHESSENRRKHNSQSRFWFHFHLVKVFSIINCGEKYDLRIVSIVLL